MIEERLGALAARAAERFSPDLTVVTSLSVLLSGELQGAVHLSTASDDAAGFAGALVEAARAEGLATRVVWALRSRGPHAGVRDGAVVIEVVQVSPVVPAPTVHLSERIDAARELTEKSVLAIGDEMRGIWEMARSQADRLRVVADQFSNGAADQGAHSNIATTIEQLASEMKAFGEEILERTSRQARDIEQARVWTNDIVRLGAAIASIASNARLLTFNARLESARIGEAGRGFAVIAASIQELALQVRQTNDGVAALAQNLAAALPRLNQDALSTSQAAAISVSKIDQQLGEVQGRLSALRQESWRALEDSSTTARDLEQRANQVVTHLQFQDRASQMLVEARDQAQAVMHAAGLTAVSAGPDHQVGALGRTLEPGAELAAPGTVELF